MAIVGWRKNTEAEVSFQMLDSHLVAVIGTLFLEASDFQ